MFSRLLQLNSRYWIWFLIILSMCLHLSYSIIHFSRAGTSDWADSWEYWDVGRQFNEGNWYPSEMVGNGEPYVVVAPFVPILVAASISIFGDTYWPIIILNSLLSTAMIWVLFLIGKEIFAKRIGLLLASISVFDVGYYRFNTQISKEQLVYFLLPLMLLLLTRYAKRGFKASYIIYCAIAFSVLIHSDERYFFYVPFVMLGIFLTKQLGLKRRLTHILMWLSIVLVLMVPWTIRNYNQFGEIVLLSGLVP